VIDNIEHIFDRNGVIGRGWGLCGFVCGGAKGVEINEHEKMHGMQ
jgi:hypothetical protein